MKSLSSHISESIYGNLGIDKSGWIDDWIERYNQQPGISLTDPPSLTSFEPAYMNAYRDGDFV